MDKEGRKKRKSRPSRETDWISEDGLRRERQRARELRQTHWWRRKQARGVCHYCGRVFSPSQLTMDHLVPLARGGKSTRSNCVPCCKECNTKKHSLLPLEWEEYLGSLGGG
jgi:5-methylcytosine-specific restriction endonuclease McrA